jgi:hypothetical protein
LQGTLLASHPSVVFHAWISKLCKKATTIGQKKKLPQVSDVKDFTKFATDQCLLSWLSIAAIINHHQMIMLFLICNNAYDVNLQCFFPVCNNIMHAWCNLNLADARLITFEREA